MRVKSRARNVSPQTDEPFVDATPPDSTPSGPASTAMADNIDREPITPATPVPPPRRRKNWLLRILAVLVLGPVIVIGLWMAIALNWSYSTGDRAGYIQKFSHKGWLCKTWEGELAMSPIPGSAPEIFPFSVRDESVARELQGAMGKRVALTYNEHRGIPTSCFGETNYFVSNVRVIDEGTQQQQMTPTPPLPPTTTTNPAPAPR